VCVGRKRRVRKIFVFGKRRVIPALNRKFSKRVLSSELIVVNS